VPKDDFINVVFDQVHSVKPAELMHVLTAFSEADGDQGVRYEDFLHLVQKNGEVDGLENQFRQMSASKTDPFAGGRASERQLREQIERIKVGVGQGTGGVMGFEQALRKIGSNGGVTVSQEDIIIALSKVDAQLSLDEIKAFYKVVRGNSGQRQDVGAVGGDDVVQVAEIMQLLSI